MVLKHKYKCESLNLFRYFEIANILLSKFDKVILKYITWIENFHADELAQNAYVF